MNGLLLSFENTLLMFKFQCCMWPVLHFVFLLCFLCYLHFSIKELSAISSDIGL